MEKGEEEEGEEVARHRRSGGSLQDPCGSSCFYGLFNDNFLITFMEAIISSLQRHGRMRRRQTSFTTLWKWMCWCVSALKLWVLCALKSPKKIQLLHKQHAWHSVKTLYFGPDGRLQENARVSSRHWFSPRHFLKQLYWALRWESCG